MWLDQLNLYILVAATVFVLGAGASLSDLIAAVRTSQLSETPTFTQGPAGLPPSSSPGLPQSPTGLTQGPGTLAQTTTGFQEVVIG